MQISCCHCLIRDYFGKQRKNFAMHQAGFGDMLWTSAVGYFIDHELLYKFIFERDFSKKMKSMYFN